MTNVVYKFVDIGKKFLVILLELGHFFLFSDIADFKQINLFSVDEMAVP